MLTPLKRLLAGTLRRQLVVGMTLIVACMMSVFVWDMTRREQVSEKERQTEQALALANSVAISSAEWVASRDLSGLQEIVQGLAQYPDLRHAIVLNLRGQVLAHTEPGRRGQYLDDFGTAIRRSPTSNACALGCSRSTRASCTTCSTTRMIWPFCRV